MSRENREGPPRCQKLLNKREGGWFNDYAQCPKQEVPKERFCSYHLKLRKKYFEKIGKPYVAPSILQNSSGPFYGS
jgi:hypothetical protein